MRLWADNVRMAFASLRSSRWRSLLTMFGVIVGVSSVVLVVGIGEGIKQQISGQIDRLGKDVVTVQPGTNASSQTSIGGLVGGPAGGTLTAEDLQAVATVPGIAAAAPLGAVAAPVTIDGKGFDAPIVLASNAAFPKVLHQKIAFGEFFDDDSEDAVVIGKNVAQDVFKQHAPLGREISVLGRQFIVRGVLDQFDDVPLSLTANMNDAIILPYKQAAALTNGSLQTYRILALPADGVSSDQAVTAITQSLKDKHGGQRNFSVLRQDQTQMAANNILSLIAGAIAGVAAIALLVGGIGIMNVMLVSVTERMHEIGIRKAIGATSRQILSQFLIEAMIVSLSGGVIGVIIALAISAGMNVFTDFHVAVDWWVALLAVVVSAGIGIIFGTAPALKAARKDPIQALRHE